MATLSFDYDLFIVQFPAYSNPTTYPEATLQVYWDVATNYVSDNTNCAVLNENSQIYALNLMTAHMAYLNGLIAGGQVPGLVQSAQIDKINVDLTPPPLPNQFAWWLSLTPYGQQLYALLQVSSVGGFYIGGTATRFGVSIYYPYGVYPGCVC